MNNFCKNLLPAFILFFVINSASAQFRQFSSSQKDSLCAIQDFSKWKILSFNKQQQPFFCRQEEKIFNRTGVNIKIRVGGYDYTEWMERKPNSFYNNFH